MPKTTESPAGHQSILTNSDVGAIVRRVVSSSGGHWRAAHAEVLLELRNRADQKVDAIVEPVRRELAEVRNWRSRTAAVVAQATTDTRNDLEELSYRVDQLEREELPGPADLETPTSTQWLVLLTMIAAFVALEAGANMMLLAPALETGLVGAFVTAVLVSVVNVGALGTGAGLILFQMQRLGTGRVLFMLGCAAIAALAVVFNLIVGRHRESFEQLIELREAQGPTTDVSLTSARQLAETISLSPAEWEMRSFLFFVLGLALCGVGLYKGYTFFKLRLPAAARRRQENIEAVQQRYQGLSKQRRDGLKDELDREVAQRVVRLDGARQEGRLALNNLVRKWNQGAHLGRAEAQFIMEHDTRYPDKVRRDMLAEHRDEPGVAPLPLDPDPALRTLDRADQFVETWRDEGDREFSASIAEGIRQINEDWARYRPMINRSVRERPGAFGESAGSRPGQPDPSAHRRGS